MRSVAFTLGAAISAAAAAVDAPSFLSATHWAPCYYISPLPSLWDGCAALARTGTTSIKLILAADPDGTYPWNTDWNPIMANVTTLADLAATNLYDTAFRGRSTEPAWGYTTFAVITYALQTGGFTYWCDAFTDADAAFETAEFAGLTKHFLTAFAGSQKRFMLEHWEGDWSARCGSYDGSKPASPAVQLRMTQWLQARQDGVEAGRAQWCREARPAGVDCGARDAGAAIHAAAGVEVFHASEVNLVLNAMTTGFPDNILKVIPYVRLDMVSYSSYDTMALSPGFADALDFIAAHHNRTAASPTPAVFVAEFGVAQNEESTENLIAVYNNVVRWAASTNPATGVQRASNVFAWELFDNEVNPSKQFPGGRCNAATGPQFNASDLHGFWMIRPDGSPAPNFYWMQAIINGSAPLPQPPSGPTQCAQSPGFDDNTDGFGTTVATQDDCCSECGGNMRCRAAVFVPNAPKTSQNCWIKLGVDPVAKKDVVLLVPK